MMVLLAGGPGWPLWVCLGGAAERGCGWAARSATSCHFVTLLAETATWATREEHEDQFRKRCVETHPTILGL